ncbi:chaperone protein dnaJ 11, chloroplastic-like [Triticum dicoccoides]|nr:chaperone protein dnaJ 11, chloroplastic-like [Triticum dicoccoides]
MCPAAPTTADVPSRTHCSRIGCSCVAYGASIDELQCRSQTRYKGHYLYIISSRGRVAGARRCVLARASATMAPPARRTHYEVLGVGVGASRGEIKAAYRRLARDVHPDAAGAGGDEGFIRLHAAYATLADPDERARYDQDVASRAAVITTRRAAGPAFRRRTWETDQCW